MKIILKVVSSIIAVSLISLATACGAQNTPAATEGAVSTTTSSSAATTQSTAAEEEKSEPITITMAEFVNKDVEAKMWDNFEALVKERYPGYELILDRIPGTASSEDYIKSRIAGGDFPDVMKVWQPALLIDGGVVQEISKELEDMILTPDYFRVNGKLYTMPRTMGALGYWYNKDIFQRAGIEQLPETWAEFMAACEKIKAIGVEPFSVSVKEGWYLASMWNYLWSPSTYGPEPNWSKLRSEGKVKFNNPVSKRVLEQLAETSPFWQKGSMSADYSEITALFFTGQTALFSGGIYNAAEVDNGDFTPDFEIGYLTPPQDNADMRRVNIYQDDLFVISSGATGAVFDASVNLIKLFFDPDFYPEVLTTFGGVPTVKGFEGYGPVYTDQKAITMLEEISAALAKYGTVPHAHAAQGDNMWPAGCREMSEKMVQELASGNNDLDALMDLFDDQWDKGLEQAEQG